MAPCDDTDDSPDGSIEDLREDFVSATEAFREQAQENLEKREAGIPVAQRTAGEPEGEPEDAEVKQPPFNPDPVMLVRHFKEGERREIPRRREIINDSEKGWEDIHPLRSDSISVIGQGEETNLIGSNQTYSVECSVSNLGGMAARNVVVELFIEHLLPSATIDINEEVGKFQMRKEPPEFDRTGNPPLITMSGTTTMSPESNLYAVFYQDEGDTPQEEDEAPQYSSRIGDAELSLSEYRNFAAFDNSTNLDYDFEEFFVDIWDTTRINGPDEGGIYEGSRSGKELTESGILLAQGAGQRVRQSDIETDRENHDLTGTVALNQDGSIIEAGDGQGRRLRVGKQQVSVPQNGERTVTFEYTPVRANFPNRDLPNPENGDRGEGRGMTAFYVRAYSLATNELPEDWGKMDHTKSRFMGRTEVRREL